MSADLIKKYVQITEGTQLNEGNETLNKLDELEEALQHAVDIARELEYDPILGGVVRSYTRPWLQAWIDDKHQMGSVESMRRSVAERAEEDQYMRDNEDNNDAEGIMRGPDQDKDWYK